MSIENFGRYAIHTAYAVNVSTTNITPDPNRTPEQFIRHAMLKAAEQLIEHMKEITTNDRNH